MNRRDFLTTLIQALLLSLFPWLRTERGIEIAGRAAEAMLPAAMEYGMWPQMAMWHMVRGYHFQWRQA